MNNWYIIYILSCFYLFQHLKEKFNFWLALHFQPRSTGMIQYWLSYFNIHDDIHDLFQLSNFHHWTFNFWPPAFDLPPLTPHTTPPLPTLHPRRLSNTDCPTYPPLQLPSSRMLNGVAHVEFHFTLNVKCFQQHNCLFLISNIFILWLQKISKKYQSFNSNRYQSLK